MKASEVKEVIKEAIDNPKDFPPIFLWGGPGIGKSSVAFQATQEKQVDFIDIRALLYDSIDFRGTPIPVILVSGNKVPVTVFHNYEDFIAALAGQPLRGGTEWFASGFLPIDPKWRGIIIFDELLLAPPLVTNSILQLVLDRKLGEYRFPDGGYIVSASNRETEAIGVYRLSPPLANRFVHVDFEVDLEEWIMWAIANNIEPSIIAFLKKFRSELLYKFDPNRKAFPTPRSYEFCSKIMKNTVSEDLKYELIRGCIGEGAAVELRAYMDIWNKLPDLDKILKGEDIFPDSIDIKYATVVGLVSKAKKQEHYSRLIDYSLKLQREFSVYLLKLLFAKDRTKLTSASNWKKVGDVLVVEEKILV